MRTTLTLLVTSTLVLAACGGSDDDGGLGAQQERVVTLLETGADEAGIELDEACIDEQVGQLSDGDAKALADAGLEGDADISEEGDAIGEAVFSECVDAASYAQAQVDAIAEFDESVDTECVSAALEGLTVDEIDEQVFDLATECTSEG